MVGLIMMLHFGLFALLALAWQRLGRQAPPLMRQPLLASSPSDFWGRRWNTAFHDLVATCLLPPLRRRFGLAGATMLIFVFSGLVHDLVISVPAGGGYGLPTLYFVLQGGAILLERSRTAGASACAADGAGASCFFSSPRCRSGRCSIRHLCGR